MHHDPDNNTYLHDGIRNQQYKLIYWYNEGYDLTGTNHGGEDSEWELFDCENDPLELFNIYLDPACKKVVKLMKRELTIKIRQIDDEPEH